MLEQYALALNVSKNEKLYPTYVSKHNSDCETKLLISIGEGWHYLAKKKLSALLRGIT